MVMNRLIVPEGTATVIMIDPEREIEITEIEETGIIEIEEIETTGIGEIVTDTEEVEIHQTQETLALHIIEAESQERTETEGEC